MLDECRQQLQALNFDSHVELVESDLANCSFADASLVLMNYTLQFVEVEKRLDVLKKICRSIRPGGALLVSEKFRHADPRLDQSLTELYLDYKRRNGYSELEIARKRDALENVLVPLTVEENQRLLGDAGFESNELILKWFNFGTFLAIRPV